MGIGTILVGAALLVVVVILIALPLLEQRRPAVGPDSPRRELELEHAAIVRAIRELDLDFRTGKITAEDYAVLRTAQVQRGAQVLRELDAVPVIESADDTDADADIDAEIEAQIALLRKDVPATVFSCPTCGTAFHMGDRFCAHCGHALPSTSQPTLQRDRQ
jgi:hypothetical protein